MELHHPWRRFAALTDWTLAWRELPPGVMGATCHRTRTVTLALGLSQAERRCTIAHETQHVLRGPAPPGARRLEERVVDRVVAELLVPSVDRLAEALARAGGVLEEAADDLWVDDYVLSARLEGLTPSEGRRVVRRMGDLDVLAGQPGCGSGPGEPLGRLRWVT